MSFKEAKESRRSVHDVAWPWAAGFTFLWFCTNVGPAVELYGDETVALVLDLIFGMAITYVVVLAVAAALVWSWRKVFRRR